MTVADDLNRRGIEKPIFYNPILLFYNSILLEEMKQWQSQKKQVAIFEKYGISIQNGKIVSPIGLINPLLKEGNSKTGKEVYTFSLLAGNEGNGTCVCNCVGCYAQTGFYNMPSVKKSIGRNYQTC